MDAADAALRDWAASGAMALTGRAGGAPRVSPGDPAGAVRRALSRVTSATAARTGSAPTLPDVRLLGERAALVGLERSGPRSCGGSFQMMPTADGWWGLSLPRTSDIELVPALIEAPVAADPWNEVRRWSASVTTSTAVERGRLLDLACCDPLDAISNRPGVVSRRGVRRPTVREAPRIVDLTSLWAGPLCGHLLSLAGADVIKVESIQRPDGARATPAFFDLLNHGRTMVALDFTDPADLEHLWELIMGADLVLESSRSRALQNLGIRASDAVDAGTSWLSITARGRDSNAVGFGDDVAAGAGLWVCDDETPLPCGDALADPLTGVTAAAVAAEALLDEHSVLLDVSMHDVAVAASQGGATSFEVHSDGRRWWVRGHAGSYPVLEPEVRR